MKIQVVKVMTMLVLEFIVSLSFAGEVTGKFDGSHRQTAIIESVGRNAISIKVGGEQWYFSPVGTFNLDQVVGTFAVGDFNGDKTDDIVCAYDYKKFNVGFIVFLSSENRFESSLWYSSGEGNMNPAAFASNIKTIDHNHDGLSDVLVPYLYPNGIRNDLIFFSNRNKLYR